MNLFPITFSFKKRIKAKEIDATRKEKLMDVLNHFLVKRGFKTVRTSQERTQFYDPDAFLSGIMHHSGRINKGMLTTRMVEEKQEIEIELTCINYYTIGFLALSALGIVLFANKLSVLQGAILIPAILIGAAVGLNSMVRYAAHKRFVKEMEKLAVEAIRS